MQKTNKLPRAVKPINPILMIFLFGCSKKWLLASSYH